MADKNARDDPSLLAEEGLLLVLRGNREEALPLLQRAVELGARDQAILIELARAYRTQGRAQDAIRLLEPALAEGQVEPSARRELARARLELRDYATALAESNVLIEELDLSGIQPHELPDLIDLYEVAAEAARGSGDAIRASFLYDALSGVLLRLNRRDLATQVREIERQRTEEYEQRQRAPEASAGVVSPREAQLQQARSYREHGQWWAALDASFAALAADFDNLQPFLEIAQSYHGAGRTADALALLRSVNAALQLRGAADSLPLLPELLGRFTGDTALREEAVELWLLQGRQDEAVATLSKLVDGARAQRNLDEEIGGLQRLLTLAPDRDDLVLDLAAALLRRDGSTAAESALREHARLRFAGERTLAAVAYWKAASERLPDSSLVWRSLGEALVRRGRPEEGARSLGRAADLAAKQGENSAAALYVRLAGLYDELGDMPGALRAYDRVLRLAPGDAAAQEHFVGFCLRRGRPDLAARTLRSLAQQLLTNGRQTDAVAALTQLMVLQPEDAWAYEQLVAVLTREGRRQEAGMVLRQLAAQRPGDATIRERLRALGEVVEAETRDASPGG